MRRLRRALPCGRGGEIFQTVQGVGFRVGVRVRGMRSAESSAMARSTSASVTANASLVAPRELSARRTPADLAAAIDAARRATEIDLASVAAWCALARAGHRDEALALVRQIEASPLPLPGAWLASAWLALDHRERALELLQQARLAGSPNLVFALVDPRLDALRGDRVFEQLRPGEGRSG